MANEIVNLDHHVQSTSCLIQLTATTWPGMAKLSTELMERIGNAEWLKGRKHLVNQDLLKPPKKIIARARSYIMSKSVPFAIDGFALVPILNIEDIDQRLQTIEREFWMSFDVLAMRYEAARMNAEAALGPDLYNSLEYPADLRSKYSFKWRFININAPSHSQIINPAVFAQELNKFQSMLEQTRTEAIMALRSETAGLVTHLVERLGRDEDGEPKTFKDTLYTNLTNFIEDFKNRNIFQDDTLQNLLMEINEILSNTGPASWRTNLGHREEIRNQFSTIKDLITKDLLVDAPRRRIRIQQ